MRKFVLLFMYVFAFGLIGHSWLSDSLPISTKLILTAFSLIIVGAAIAVQWNGNAEKE
jgi:hypothetical protein